MIFHRFWYVYQAFCILPFHSHRASEVAQARDSWLTPRAQDQGARVGHVALGDTVSKATSKCSKCNRKRDVVVLWILTNQYIYKYNIYNIYIHKLYSTNMLSILQYLTNQDMGYFQVIDLIWKIDQHKGIESFSNSMY